MPNPLTELLPARARQLLYALLFLAGIVVGALNIADVDTGAAIDVLAYLGTALGALAASNPTRDDGAPADDEGGYASLLTGLGAIVLVLVILALLGLL